jgi:phage FluMu protein Com
LLLRDSGDGATFRCISCGRILPLETAQVGHYVSRRYFIVRWSLTNINLQCAYCNKWLHSSPIEYRRNLIEKVGIKEVERLETIYQQPAGYTVFDLQLMYAEHMKIYEKLKAENDN